MKIDDELVLEVARLARLSLSSQEVHVLGAQLTELLGHFATLDNVDAGAVEPTTHVVPMRCVERSDQVVPSAPREVLLAAAPAHTDEFFLVPKIID